MSFDWGFAGRRSGIVVLGDDGTVIVLEFNEFLRRIASRAIGEEDRIVSGVFTDGLRRRVGDLRLFGLIRSGTVETETLPPSMTGGVLARGAEALAILRQVERSSVI